MPDDDKLPGAPTATPEPPAPGPKGDPRLPGPALPPPQFSSVRAYLKNGGTLKVVYISMNSGHDGWNHYFGINNISLCSIKRDDVSAFVNLDVPEETVPGEKGPVKVYPAGITISTGYAF